MLTRHFVRSFATASGFAAVILLLVSGCVRSVHPLYTVSDVIFDASLLGVWSNADREGTWQFTRSTQDAHDKSYRLVYTDGNRHPAVFIAHLVKLGDERFLDLFPVAPETPGNLFYRLHYQPAHTFMRLQENGDDFTLAPLNPEWLNKLLNEQPDAVSHTVVTPSGHPPELEDDKDRRILLTGSTEELQQFLLRHAGTSGMFADPVTLGAVQ